MFREALFFYPFDLCDILFLLRYEIAAAAGIHLIPPGMLEAGSTVETVGVVGYADKPAEFQPAEAGLFAHFAERAVLYGLAIFLMTFREVPQAASAYHQELAVLVADKTAGCGQFAEFSAELLENCIIDFDALALKPNLLHFCYLCAV